MNITLIHNPSAGDDRFPDASRLQRMVEKAGHELQYQSSKDDDWAEALKAPADLVVVAGGDGTVARVAKRLIGKKLPMTALAMGTANNISRSLGLADLAIEDQIASWENSGKSEIDAGMASGPWGESPFIEGVGIGLFAWIMPRADNNKKLLKMDDADSAIHYALKMFRKRLREHPPHRVNATLDGQDISGDYLLFEAMNMQFIGPNLYLAPKGRPNDGFLDVVVVTDGDREEMDKYLAHWQKRKLTPPEFPTFRGRHLQFEPAGHAIHLDDKMMKEAGKDGDGEIPVEVKILPAALQILTPP